MTPAYLSHPHVNGDHLVFVAEDDIWLGEMSGGPARRLTSLAGIAAFPRLRSDSTEVAFTAQDRSGQDVWCVPTSGGDPQRLTWLASSVCQVRSWTPDGRVAFTTDAYLPFRQMRSVYSVGSDGGLLGAMPFGGASDVTWGDEGLVVVGRNTWDPARWKRNRGGSVGRLWIDRDGSGNFEPLLPSHRGNVAAPMLIDGRIWFVSDEDGIGNLWSVDVDGAGLQQHTKHATAYARWPSTDGRAIVYQHAGDIWSLSPATGESARLELTVGLSGRRTRPRSVRAGGSLRAADARIGVAFDVGHGQVALAARASVVLRHSEGTLQLLEPRDVERRRLPRITASGALACVVEEDAPRIEWRAADGTVSTVTLPPIGRVAQMVPNPCDGTLAVTTHRHELHLVDAQGNVRRIDGSDHGALLSPTWSPCGRWLAYVTAVGSEYTRQIRVWRRDNGEIHAVTNGEFADGSPSFDPTGRYLYFLSARSFAAIDDATGFGLHVPRPVRAYVVPLRAGQPSPFGAASAIAEPLGEDGTVIDLDGIELRVTPIPVAPARYGAAIGMADGVLLRSDPFDGGGEFTLMSERVSARSSLLHVGFDGTTTTWADGVTDVVASLDRGVVLAQRGQDLFTMAAGAETPYDLADVQVQVRPRSEWLQIYDETVRLLSDHLWDFDRLPGPSVWRRYRALIERAASRVDVSDIIWEAIGELGVSHAYELPGDLELPEADKPGRLAAELTVTGSGLPQITALLAGDPWEPGADSGTVGAGRDLCPGDVIREVGGRTVQPWRPLEEHSVGLAGQEITVVVDRDGTRLQRRARLLTDERAVRYRAFVDANRRFVHESTGGAVGYVHVPNMGAPGYSEFRRSYSSESARDHLIVDVRFNEGGFSSTLLLDVLSRRRMAWTLSPWRAPAPFPRQAPGGIVVICNEHTGSDGDMFVQAVRELGLAPIVGVRTWGGVVGISPREPLADGTVVTQPENAHWFDSVGYGVEGHGAEPTHVVEISPSEWSAGHDTQLESAIALARSLPVRSAPPGARH